MDEEDGGREAYKSGAQRNLGSQKVEIKTEGEGVERQTVSQGLRSSRERTLPTGDASRRDGKW